MAKNIRFHRVSSLPATGTEGHVYFESSTGLVYVFTGSSFEQYGEDYHNKVTKLSENCTNLQYPSAKAVYDVIVENEEITASALCDLDERLSDVEDTYVDGTRKINGIPLSSDVTLTTLDLVNNSGYITKAVSDLTNYYTKTEVDELIDVIDQFSVSLVDSLPEASEDVTRTIYFVPNSGEGENVKDEYICIGSSGTYAWEKIGSTDIDLTGYATIEYIDEIERVTATALTDLDSRLGVVENTMPEKQDALTAGSGIAIENNVISVSGIDSVKFTPQTLTEAQQMQARANQGLYYKESELSDTLEWDGNTEGLESVDGFYKVSEPVDPSLLNNCVVTTVSEGEYDSITASPVQNPMYPTIYTIINAFLVTEDTEFMGETWSKGIWFYNDGEGDSVVSIQATAPIFNTTTIHHIGPEYIKDMYYKEDNRTDTLEWDGNTEGKEMFYPGGLDSTDSGYVKIAEAIEDSNLLVGGTIVVNLNGEEEQFTLSEFLPFGDGAGYASDGDAAGFIYVILKDTEWVEEQIVHPGLYVLWGEQENFSMYVPKIIAPTSIFGDVTVHPVPDEYIPDTVMKKVPMATPGNIAVLDSAGEVNELPAGTEGQVLTQGENGAEWKDPTGGELMVPITYADLKELRDNGELVPGMQYRITDYHCTTVQENTRSADHQFDIIVTADDEKTLNENARAINHAEPTITTEIWIFSDPDVGEDPVKVERTPSNDIEMEGIMYYSYGPVGPFDDVYSTNEIPEEGDHNVYVLSGGGTAIDKLNGLYFHHETVTNNYFDTANLSAWELKYSLDNDTDRFAWAKPQEDMVITNDADYYRRCPSEDQDGEYAYAFASCQDHEPYNIYEDGEIIYTRTPIPEVGDVTFHPEWVGSGEEPYSSVFSIKRTGGGGGKGVIYYMKDEWGNECPYDFKNIQFKRKLTDGEYDPNNGTDTWVYTFNSWHKDDGKCHDASSDLFYISAETRQAAIDNEDGADECDVCKNNVIKQYQILDSYGYFENKFALNDIVFLGCSYDEGYDDGYSVVYIYSNTFGNNCYSNTFGNGCSYNTFGYSCDHNTFGEYCNSNTFGNNYDHNTFGDYCNENIFGNGCSENTFGDNSWENTFGDYCNENIFGNGCSENTFGNFCSSNTFGYSCDHNTFGNACSDNTFDENGSHNAFGNGCYYNTFGYDCEHNTFSNGCSYNTFGRWCRSNTFGNGCSENTFGNSSPIDYCRYIVLGDGVQYCKLYGTTTPTMSANLQNIKVAQGLQGTSNNKLAISIATGLDYETKVALNSSGELKIYCEADLIA